MYLPEARAANDPAGRGAVGAVRRDEGRDDDQAGIVHQAGDFGDAPDVLAALGWRKAEVAVQAPAQFVAVEYAARMATIVQFAFERSGQRRLAGATEARQPERQGLLTEPGGTLGGADKAGVADDPGSVFGWHRQAAAWRWSVQPITSQVADDAFCHGTRCHPSVLPGVHPRTSFIPHTSCMAGRPMEGRQRSDCGPYDPGLKPCGGAAQGLAGRAKVGMQVGQGDRDLAGMPAWAPGR